MYLKMNILKELYNNYVQDCICLWEIKLQKKYKKK